MLFARKEKFFLVISALYVVALILSNLTGGKLFHFNDGLVSASLFLYPLSYFIGDLVTELYGGKRARFLIVLGFSMAVLMQCLALFLIALPVASVANHYQFALETLFSFNGLSLTASLVAFLISQLLDVKLYLWIKQKTGQRKLWLRTNVSTILSQIVDCFLINFILFFLFLEWPIIEVFTLFLSAVILKVAFSILLTPFFYAAVFASERYILDHEPSVDRSSLSLAGLRSKPKLF